MRIEFERAKSRSAERAKRPIGGYVLDAPFPQFLHKLAVAKGYESQNSFSKALGKKTNSSVHRWYSGKLVPSPKEYGNIIVVLEPIDEELETLDHLYGQLLIEGRGVPGRSIRLERSIRKIKPSSTPIGQWIENFCKDTKTTLTQMLPFIRRSKPPNYNRDSFSLRALNLMRENGPEAWGLSEEQRIGFYKAVDETIKIKLSRANSNRSIKVQT